MGAWEAIADVGVTGETQANNFITSRGECDQHFHLWGTQKYLLLGDYLQEKLFFQTFLIHLPSLKLSFVSISQFGSRASTGII